MRVVFDSNVWISAFRFKGRPLDLVRQAAEGEFELYTSQSIIQETTRVLREKFDASKSEIEQALRIIEATARKVEPAVKLDLVKDDSSDNHILECAVTAGADFIVTGDKKHLLKMGEHQGIRMISVVDLIGRMSER